MFDRRMAMAAMAGGALLPRAAWADERRVVTARIALENNRVMITVSMNGAGPYPFMIDTGTYISMIHPDLAKRLKLPFQGYERTKGVAGRGKPFAYYLAKDVVIGGGLRQPTVVLTDAFDFGNRSDVYGALAAGVLTAYDTDLDFDAGELRIYPDGRGERTGYVATDAIVPRDGPPDRGSRRITATVLLDGRPIRCIFDTGAPHVLLLNQTAARRLGYWDDSRANAPYLPNGVGGTGSLGRIIRAGSLEMSGARADRPLIALLGDDVDGAVDGILGLSFIRRFNLSFDSAGRRLWVKPSQQPLVPERYGASGVWLNRNGGAIVVAAVGPGSPAAQAGLRVGDRIDGEWSPLLRAIGGRPGEQITLNVRRDGAVRPVQMMLAPYL